MPEVLLSLAVLACPVGMGLMMFFMGKGMKRDKSSEAVPASLETLRAEHARMGEDLDRAEAADVGGSRDVARAR
ncbi:MAG: hypothetical protein M3417_00585 [Actinomycetota bacterium]|nr:hypothetical protein [Actinomycetota bacterium]